MTSRPFLINIENHSDTPKSFRLFGAGRLAPNFGNPEGIAVSYALNNYTYVQFLTDSRLDRSKILANIYCYNKDVALKVVGVDMDSVKINKTINCGSGNVTNYVDELSAIVLR